MAENIGTVVKEQGEPVTTTTEPKNDPFAILETEPIFASDDKPVKPTVDLNLTLTPEELKAKNDTEITAKAEETAQLAAKAKELGLSETATKEEISAAETKIVDELKTKAVELGLPETATKEEISAAELKKSEPEGFVTESELQTGMVGAEDGTWKALMMAKGLEIPEDFNEDNGFDIYTKAEENNWNQKIEDAKIQAQEQILSGLKPELRAAIELANAMPEMTLEQILSPTLQIDNLLRLDKEELIREEIKASNPKYTPEMVDIEMQKIKDANQIDIIDNKIRLDLSTGKEKIQAQHNERIQQYQHRQQELKLADEQKRIEQINKVLDRDLTYLDKKLSATDRQFLREKINKGYINELLNNPEKIVNALLDDQFRQKGMTQYENRVREKVLLEQKQRLHNTPTLNKGSANEVAVKKPITNQFDILKVDFGEEK